ncbi:MAG: DUF86 domain-containing protein [Methanomassiliicoccaceae archaeon]|nr:DUF86 domain-containing protein [Methanomassiliicoccaceae archaeon]
MGKDAFQIKSIIIYCDMIEDAMNTFGNDIEDFMENVHYHNVCSFYISQIGEAIKPLSKELTEKYPEIKWREIRETRDDIAHIYHKIDMETIWVSITEDIPLLKKTCKRILCELEKS